MQKLFEVLRAFYVACVATFIYDWRDAGHRYYDHTDDKD
jgi:hypothetical protein